jgi:sporulation protein YlmC with PRC-barrel domain
VELNSQPAAFSDLIGRPVHDGSGRSLGRVFEARAHWDRDGFLVLDKLIVGRRGLWRRLRGPDRETHGIPWESVTELGPAGIVIRS